MDTASTLIGIGLLLVFISPIAFMLLKQSGESKKHQRQLLALSSQYHLNLTHTESLSNISIGLDVMSKKLLILIFGKTTTEFLIDLNDISSSKVQKLLYEDSIEEKNLDNIREIYLEIKMKEGPAQNKLVFFEEVSTSVLEKESRLNTALKWNQLITNFIKK